MTEPAKGRVGFFELNDKNSLCWRESIGGMALYGNGKVSTTYAVIGLGYSERACEGCQGQAGISLRRWNLLGLVSFLAKSG